jgi:hypothetical protein
MASGAVLALSACATSGTAVSDPGSTRTTTARRTNVITAEEIAENRDVVSVGDLVRKLRPGWPRTVTVFLNNDPQGDYSVMNQLGVSSARELRYLSASEAQMKWGMRFREVIQIITR